MDRPGNIRCHRRFVQVYGSGADAREAQLDLPIEPSVPPEQQEMLDTLRNMWEFASLMQYIFLFGHVVKIDEDFDIEVRGHPRTSAIRYWGAA